MKIQFSELAATKRKRYENLVSSHCHRLYTYAYWICGEKTVAQDLVQETFLHTWQYLDLMLDESAAKRWLVTSLCREFALRSEDKSYEFADIEGECEEIVTHPEVAALKVALKELPSKYREPLILQVLEGHSLDEISTILSLPKSTVAARVQHARHELMEQGG